MTSLIEYQPPQYNSNPNDSRTLDHEETILGHLLVEKQYSLKDSLYYLTSYAKEESKTWDDTETIANGGFWVSLVAAGTAMVAMGSGPLGLTVGGVVAAIGAGSSWILKDTAETVGKLRRTEFELHRHHPWIRDRLWEMSQQGATAAELVAIYDRMVFGLHANGIPSDGNAIAGSMQMQSIAPSGSGTAPQTLATPPGTGIADAVVQHQNASPTGLMNPATVQTELRQPRSAAPSMSSTAIEPRDIAIAASPDYLKTIKSVISRNSCFFVGGARGAGKGVMVSNLIRWKLDQFPGSIAVWFDPKGSPREDGNFADPRITRLKISGIGMSEEEFAIEVAEQMEIARTFIDRADVENGKHVFFVFDEIMNLKQKLDKKQFKAIQNLLVDCVSMGDDSGIHAISITQSFNAGESVGSDELMKNMALIACLKKDDYPRARKLVQFGKTNHSDFSEEEFNRLVRKSPRDRVMCIGGTFIPAPEMPLLSGWDRDNQKHVDKSGATASSPKKSTYSAIGVTEDPADNEAIDLSESFQQSVRDVMTVVGSSPDLKEEAIDVVVRSQKLATSGNAAGGIQILEAFKENNMRFAKPEKPVYETSVMPGRDCVVVYSGDLHPEDFAIRKELSDLGYTITFEDGLPYSKYFVTWKGLRVFMTDVLREIENAYYGEGWDA